EDNEQERRARDDPRPDSQAGGSGDAGRGGHRDGGPGEGLRREAAGVGDPVQHVDAGRRDPGSARGRRRRGGGASKHGPVPGGDGGAAGRGRRRQGHAEEGQERLPRRQDGRRHGDGRGGQRSGRGRHGGAAGEVGGGPDGAAGGAGLDDRRPAERRHA